MESSELIELTSHTMALLVAITAPPVGASLLVGLLVAIVQTATQVQEQTVGFAARASAVAISLVIAGPWMTEQLLKFSRSLLELIQYIQL